MEQVQAPIKLKECDPNFIKEVIAVGGRNAQLCFECGTCSGGCPAAYAMDYTPRQILRMVELGMRDKVLQSYAIWACAGCYTCTTRCPRGVNLADVMKAIKSIALKEGIGVNRKAGAFYNAFAEEVRLTGRVNEPLLMLRFALKSTDSLVSAVKNLLVQAPLGVEMAQKRKIGLPERIANIDDIKKIFEKVKKDEGKD